MYTPHPNRISGRAWLKIIERIAIRDGYVCQHCKRVTHNGEVDHIKPLHKDGTNDDDNLQWLCKPCHSDKTLLDTGRRPKLAIAADGWPK